MDALETLQNSLSGGIVNLTNAGLAVVDAQLSPFENGQAGYYIVPQPPKQSSNAGLLILLVIAVLLFGKVL